MLLVVWSTGVQSLRLWVTSAHVASRFFCLFVRIYMAQLCCRRLGGACLLASSSLCFFCRVELGEHESFFSFCWSPGMFTAARQRQRMRKLERAHHIYIYISKATGRVLRRTCLPLPREVSVLVIISFVSGDVVTCTRCAILR